MPLGGSTLAQYEKGTVWAPDPGVLWGLAQIYEQPVEVLILMLRANRANPSLQSFDGHEVQRHARTASTKAGTAAHALEQRLVRDQAVGKEIEAVARQLLTIAAKLDHTKGTTAPAAKRSRGNQKAG